MKEEKAPILSVKDLSVILQVEKGTVTVVDQLSFSLHKGKTLAIVGESGCGKTMSALALMRILPQPPSLPPKGEVIFSGVDLLQLSEKEMRKVRGKKIAMIFQDPMSALNPVYSIGYQLDEVAQIHIHLYGEEAKKRSISALDDVGISEPERCYNAYPHELSGGMKQRVMIAMALMCEPDVLIADEPTTALDVTIQAQILDLIRNLQRTKGMGVILITHDMGVVAEMADDVVVMYASQAIEVGDVLAIYDHMSHPYTQGLFQSLPHIHTQGTKLQVIKGQVPTVGHFPSGCHFNPRCPHVMPMCLEGDVPAFPLEKPDHWAKCWLYREKEDRNE